MQIETLESRQHFSVSLNLTSQVLNIVGGAGNDVITVKQVGTTLKVTENGVSRSVAKSAVKLIVADGGDGIDSIKIDPNVTLPTKLSSGASSYDFGREILQGGSGNDVLTTGTSDYVDVNGGAGNDIITANTYGSNVDGGTGDDAIFVNGSYISAIGGAGKDYLKVQGLWNAGSGGSGNDTVEVFGENSGGGGDGNDTLICRGYDSYVTGGAGDDTFQVYAVSYASGEAGNDKFLMYGFEGYLSSISGGNGTDTVDCSSMADDIILGNSSALDFTTGRSRRAADDDSLGTSIGDDVEVLIGGSGDDAIYGGSANNRLEGRSGDDYLNGGAGNDALFGGAGDDYLDSWGDGDTDYDNGGLGYDTIDADGYDSVVY